MAVETNGLRIEEGRTKLLVPHRGEELAFLHSALGPDTYATVGEKIEQDGLKRPTMAETASLLHGAFNSNDKYAKEFKDRMENWAIWAFTGTLYVPNGAYIQDNPKIRDRMPFMDESDLVKKLEANDPSVRFVPFGYKTGKMSPLELGKNPYVTGLAGEEGAEKLAEVADKFRENPYLRSFNSVDYPETRVSALESSWYLYHTLYVEGNSHGNYVNRCAFGVQQTGGASRAEK